MLNQYGAQRTVRGPAGRRIGTIPVGTIVYIQDGVRPMGGFDRHHRIVRREPWQVEAWIPRAYTQYVSPGHFRTVRMAGGHLAQVRSLRTGRRAEVSDWILLACIDAGLEKL
jgi:hypothetical protein